MPDHFRVMIDGSWPVAGEVFCTGMAVTGEGSAPSQGPLTAWADAIMTLLASSNDGAVNFRAMIGLTGQIDRVRVYYYPTVGGPASLQAVSSGTPITGSGSITTPPQCARVITLNTGIPGRRTRGRMFWPKVTGTVGSTFTDSSISTSTATNVATFLAAIADVAPTTGDMTPAVVSVAGNLVTLVTSISIGNVVDTQRRRRDAVQETRFSAAIP